MKRLLHMIVIAGVTAGFFFSVGSCNGARTLTLADLRNEVTLADPQISPDGSHVALLVGHNDFIHTNFSARCAIAECQRNSLRITQPNTLPLTLSRAKTFTAAGVGWFDRYLH